MAANFVRGFSRFNNVLWTMKIELFGSLAIFLLYALTQGRVRLLALAVGGVVVVLWLSDAYMGFVLGAALYEAHRRRLLHSPPVVVSVLALVAAVVLGGPGEGAHVRLDLPNVPPEWHLGRSRRLVVGLAAALLIYATLTLPALGSRPIDLTAIA